MTIVAGGDSFVYGLELADCTSAPSKCTFTSLLAGNEYDCVAWGGYGNDSIARTVIARCEQERPTGVIVSWSFVGRYEFRFAYNTRQVKSPWYSINSWTIQENVENIKQEFVTENHGILKQEENHINRAKQTGVHEFAKTFFKHVGSTEYWEVYSTLKEIVYLQNYLELKQIPFMFTCVDNNILYNNTIGTDHYIDSLYKQIDHSKWFWFPIGTRPNETQNPRGFYQWAVENKYRIGTTHPLEEAHQAAAELMKDKFNELVKKPVQ
jgi:hypothetical protein